MRHTAIPAGVALAACLALPITAAAQATDQTAAQLESDLKRLLTEWMRPMAGLIDMVFEGDITVAAEEDHYVAAIPAYELAFAGLMSMGFGPSEWQLDPAGDGQYMITMSMPAVLNIDSVDIGLSGDMTYGDGETTALVDFETGWISAYESHMEDMVQTFDATGGGANIALFTMSGEHTRTGPGMADAYGDLIYEGYESLDSQFGLSVTADRIATEWAVEALNVDSGARLMRIFADLIPGSVDLEPDEEAIAAAFRGALSQAPLFANAAFSFDYDNLRYEVFGFGITFEETDGVCNMSGFADEVSTLDCSGGMSIAGLEPAPPLGAELIPSEIVMGVAFERVPRAAMIDALAVALDRIPVLGEDQAFAEAGLAITAAMGDVASEVELSGLRLEAPAYSLVADGTLTVAADSPLGVTAAATVTLGRVEQLRQALAGLGDEAALMLEVISAIGRPEVDASGNPVLVFDIALTTAGEALVNGSDMEALMP